MHLRCKARSESVSLFSRGQEVEQKHLAEGYVNKTTNIAYICVGGVVCRALQEQK